MLSERQALMVAGAAGWSVLHRLARARSVCLHPEALGGPGTEEGQRWFWPCCTVSFSFPENVELLSVWLVWKCQQGLFVSLHIEREDHRKRFQRSFFLPKRETES